MFVYPLASVLAAVASCLRRILCITVRCDEYHNFSGFYSWPVSYSDAPTFPLHPFVQVIRLESFYFMAPFFFSTMFRIFLSLVRFAYVPNYTDYNAGIGDVALVADVVS